MLLLLIAARIPFDTRHVIAVLSVGWSSIAKVLNKLRIQLWWPISATLVLLGQRVLTAERSAAVLITAEARSGSALLLLFSVVNSQSSSCSEKSADARHHSS
jgi:hypothetical protein